MPSTFEWHTSYPSIPLRRVTACCRQSRPRIAATWSNKLKPIAVWIIQPIIDDPKLPSFAIDVHTANQANASNHAMLIAALIAAVPPQSRWSAVYPTQCRRTKHRHSRTVAAVVLRCPTISEESVSRRASSD